MAPTRQHNLPAPHPHLIGREQDSATVGELVLQTPGRLVTLVGTGGCGKTQLALYVAAAGLPRFTDGVWLVDLAPVRDPVLVPYAVATALGRPERAGETLLDTLLDFLASRELLLVLDNCEHLIEACAALADRVLAECSTVRLLATSREPLRIANETAWRVPSLAVPDPGPMLEVANLLAYPSIQLFVERAQAVQQSFTLGAENASCIVGICTRLEGLPLAVELAAARVRALSLQQILERLDDSFRLLVGGSRTAPTRQQTLRIALDWSYNLLADAEHAVFRRVAVFAGGWTVEAAEAVCSGDGVPQTDVLELLTCLVDKSLVVAEEKAGRSRYRLLEPIRQYASARLVESSELDSVRRRHATNCMAFAETLERDANAGGIRRQAATDALATEYRNLQAALRWCVDAHEAQVGLRLARALQFQWKHYGPYGEGLLWINELLGLPDAAEPTPARAMALLTAAHLEMVLWNDRLRMRAFADEAGHLARLLGDQWILSAALAELGIGSWHLGDLTTARSAWEEALAMACANGDVVSEAAMLINLGRLAIYVGNYGEGCAQCEAGLRHGQALGDAWLISMALPELGWAALAQGDVATARVRAQDCLSLAPQDPIIETTVLTLLGIVETAQGHGADARDHLVRSLVRQRELGLTWFIPDTLEGLAGLANLGGHPRLALQLAGAASAVRDALAVPEFPLKRDLVDRWFTPLRQIVGNDAVVLGWAEGSELSLDMAIRLALAETEPERRSPARSNAASVAPTGRQKEVSLHVVGLTSREAEVLRLVARGQSNKEIAAELVLSVRTVERHITNLYGKIDARGKADATAYAIHHGIV